MAFKTDERYKISKCYDHELLQDKYNLTLKFNNLAIWIPFLKVGDMLALPP